MPLKQWSKLEAYIVILVFGIFFMLTWKEIEHSSEPRLC